MFDSLRLIIYLTVYILYMFWIICLSVIRFSGVEGEVELELHTGLAEAQELIKDLGMQLLYVLVEYLSTLSHLLSVFGILQTSRNNQTKGGGGGSTVSDFENSWSIN